MKKLEKKNDDLIEISTAALKYQKTQSVKNPETNEEIFMNKIVNDVLKAKDYEVKTVGLDLVSPLADKIRFSKFMEDNKLYSKGDVSGLSTQNTKKGGNKS